MRETVYSGFYENKVESLRSELNEKHAQELEKVQADMLAMADSSQSEQLEQLMTSNREEMDRVRAEASTSISEIHATHNSKVAALQEQISTLMSDNIGLSSDRSSLEEQLQALRG